MPTVRTGDIETYYERRGDGPPVVFVHASILDHSMWDQQVDALDGEYTSVVYDMRGHGRTGGSNVSDYTVERYVEDLHALVDALDLESFVLCGLSFGGVVAQAYAASHPDRVAGLVVAEPFTPSILTRGEWFLFEVAMRAMIPLARIVGFERIERVNARVAEFVASGSRGDYGNVERLRETGPRMTTDEFAKVIRSMIRMHDSSIDYSAITAPTLVLYGENELPFVKRHVTELATRISDVDVDVVPDAGHASNLDNPGDFTNAVREFLARIHVDNDAGGDGDAVVDSDAAASGDGIDADG